MSLYITVCVCVIRGKKENVLSDIMKKRKNPTLTGYQEIQTNVLIAIPMNTLCCRDNVPVVSVSPRPPQPIL